MTGDTELKAGLAKLQAQLVTLPDDWSVEHIEMIASRLEGLHYTPPVITPIGKFLRWRNTDMAGELLRMAAMVEPIDQVIDTGNWPETQLDELYVHD
jgi:hypothetical protein